MNGNKTIPNVYRCSVFTYLTCLKNNIQTHLVRILINLTYMNLGSSVRINFHVILLMVQLQLPLSIFI